MKNIKNFGILKKNKLKNTLIIKKILNLEIQYKMTKSI
jgi:hypothetical protein